MEDIREHKNGKFITLTFSDEAISKLTKELPKSQGYDLDNDIATLATRRFLERYRKQNKKSIRHWLITELGHNGTENIHLHGIIYTDENKEEIEKKWQYGHIWLGTYVNEATINYIVKYVNKQDEKHKQYNSKILTSAGIGKHYTTRPDSKTNKYKEKETKETYRTRDGTKINLPIYWRNKIYTEEEKEKLWIQRLDKQERWILGQKIDVSKGYEQYNRALKTAQAKNEKLGYASDKKTWQEDKYERERRQMKQQERIEKGKRSLKTPAAGYVK